jgi:hypothetical protein
MDGGVDRRRRFPATLSLPAMPEALCANVVVLQSVRSPLRSLRVAGRDGRDWVGFFVQPADYLCNCDLLCKALDY